MILPNTRFRRALAPLAMLALATACSHTRTPPLAEAPPPPPKAAPAYVRADEVAAVAGLLNDGKVDEARTRLATVLRHDPDDPEAKVLEEGLDGDPTDLLGPKNFAYTVAPGETMTGLAERFLGNGLKSYQLARYNGIAIPSALTAGTALKIPGAAPVEAGARGRTASRPMPANARTARPHDATSAPATAARATPAANPAAAARLRGAGLASLNGGHIDQAIALLSRAAALDPSNALIRRDLMRAQRIQTSVRARR